MTQREMAIYTAGYAHKDQMYGESPYLFHLSAADQILEDVGYQPDHSLRIAVWLHDTLEDTSLTEDYLEKNFGQQLTSLVKAVTNEPGKNRKNVLEKLIQKLRTVGIRQSN